jgi:hypothetical protein
VQTSKTIEDEVGLSSGFCQRLMLTEGNVPVLLDYLKCFENEISLSKSYKKITLAILVYCSRFHSNKKFKEMTKEDIISFLNSLRKNETIDPLHGWISTHNLYLVVLQRFFKWLYYPDLSPKSRNNPWNLSEETGINCHRNRHREVNEAMKELAEIKNNFESRCSIKIETNSRGHNTTVHAYEGVTFQEIGDTVEKATYAHSGIQNKLFGKTHCQKRGEWSEDNSVCAECDEKSK